MMWVWLLASVIIASAGTVVLMADIMSGSYSPKSRAANVGCLCLLGGGASFIICLAVWILR